MTSLTSPEQLEKLIIRMGFLPFFNNRIPEFSIAEFTPRHLWFSDEYDGPWEWKGPVIGGGLCVYGKLFEGLAGYVSLPWYAELIRYRRAHYHPSEEEKLIYQMLKAHESLLSKELKKLCGYIRSRNSRQTPLTKMFQSETHVLMKPSKSKRESFETAMTRLQMGGYVVIADFEYLYTADGRPYGWGIARYTTPEALYDKSDFQTTATHIPEESKQLIFDHLHKLLPQAMCEQVLKVIG